MGSETIDGVYIKKIVPHEDARGFFAELMKEGEAGFHKVTQTSYAETEPGVIKAFHYHEYAESWVLLKGSARVVLYDRREGSRSRGIVQSLIMTGDAPILLSIPPGVAHGYKALGTERSGMLYHAEEAYDPSRKDQIQTIPNDAVEIGFDWTKE